MSEAIYRLQMVVDGVGRGKRKLSLAFYWAGNILPQNKEALPRSFADLRRSRAKP